ncbi:MAG TPA: DUF2125 domain-containing protein [Stellaceae bacterium]|nr:DUF2125 domain-containing protein [Stellaceae bacterium]
MCKKAINGALAPAGAYNPRMRRWSYGLAVLAIAAYGGYWLSIARSLERGLAPRAATLRAQGYDVTWQSVAVGGFPFTFRLRFAGAALRTNRPAPLEARSAELIATATPFELETWHVTAPRGASLDATSLAAGIDAATLEGSVATTDEGTAIDIAAHDVVGRGLAHGLAADTFDAALTLPRQAPQSHRDPALSLTASLQQATLPAAAAFTHGKIGVLAVAGTFDGRLPPGPLAPALAAWRDDGGTVDLDRAHLQWDGTTIDLAGTLALDAAMQPEGALTATVVGADKAVDAAVDAGWLAARYAGVAKSVLHAIAATDAGGTDALHMPLTIEDQRLYIGPAAIAVMPRITWQ